jgi:hypothetical protein
LAHRHAWASQRPNYEKNFNAHAQKPDETLSATSIAICKSVFALAFPKGKFDEAALRRLPPGLFNLCLRLAASETLQKAADPPSPRFIGIRGLDLDKV